MNKYPNSGALFKNDRKEKPNHPDYKGSAEIDGADYWVSAWIKEGKNGEKFMSLSYKEKESRAEEAKAVINDTGFTDNELDDLPF